MKHIIILGDGMADHKVERLGGKTLLQYADTPYMDMLAKKGQCGRLITVPDGYQPGSEVANTAILGYDLDEVYEGRGPLEAASIGYEMQPGDMAIRCNIITLEDGKIKNHHGGHLTTEDGTLLINYLNEKLGSDRVQFIPGIQYRHLLIIKGGNKHIECAPPHDHPDEAWRPLLVKPESEVTAEEQRSHSGGTPEEQRRNSEGTAEEERRNSEGTAETAPEPQCAERQLRVPSMSPEETAALINALIIRSQELLEEHPFNQKRKAEGKPMANSIWPWSPGYRPSMQTIMQMFPDAKSGAVISAVDLIRGIGHYAGLRIIKVDGATGLYNTNYEGKAQAAIDALRTDDFVFLHIEASDEAGHDGDLNLKLQTIENLDRRIVEPIYNELKTWAEPVCIAVLPDHPTPVEIRTHVQEPVPFIIYYPGIKPDGVMEYDEVSCVSGSYGMLRLSQFMQEFMKIK